MTNTRNDHWRRTRRVQKYLINPGAKALAWVGLLPGHTLIETTGRRSGRRRRTIVGIDWDPDGGWVIIEHRTHAGYVHNIEADPTIRVRRRHWEPATGRITDDNPEVRLNAFHRRGHAAAVRLFGTNLATLRVDFGRGIPEGP